MRRFRLFACFMVSHHRYSMIFTPVLFEDSDKLSAYVKRLLRALAERGTSFDRKFSPHITLVRQAPTGLPRLRVPSVSMEVRRVSLMRSERGKNGMIYTEIGFVESMC